MKTIMRTTCPRAGVLLLLPWLLLCSARPGLAKEQTVKLKFRAEDSEERLFVPFERRRILAEAGADLRVGDGKRLQCKVIDGERIKVDVDGSGGFAKSIKRGEVLALKIRRASGGLQRHGIRMVNDVYGRPCLEPACAQVGRLKGTPIAVLDADLNGRYADYGRDVMVVGKLPYAFPLSKTVVIGRNLFRIDVAEDGASLKATQLEEPLLKLDFTSKLGGLKKPKMVVFRRAGEGAADYVVAFRSPALLPAGKWSLAYAAFTDDLWALGGVGVKPVLVGEEPATWAWGEPFSLIGKAAVREEGTHRTFVPPGHLKAPQLIESTVAGKHIVCDFPPQVVGSAGLTYVGNWQHEGGGGVSLPDKRIAHFDVHIAKDGKRLNTDMAKWAPYDMSGLVQKVPVFWATYEWPAGSIRGRFTIAFSCMSPTFGGVVRSKPLNLDVR